TGRSDEGMDQAGSGVADDCTYSSRVVSSSICSSSGIDKTDGLSLVSVVVQAVYSAEAAVFEELGASVPLGAGQCDHGPLTSPELRISFCDLHELGRNWIPTCGGSIGGRYIVVVVVVVVVVAVNVGSGAWTAVGTG
ncbi:hypothetical protein Tco_1207859, partial [Tanacetum coccineum]